jgi:hypothetical protein
MAIDERQINAIVDAVVSRLQKGGGSGGGGVPNPGGARRAATEGTAGNKPLPNLNFVPTYGHKRHKDSAGRGKKGVFEDMDSAVAAARIAHEELLDLSLETPPRCSRRCAR